VRVVPVNRWRHSADRRPSKHLRPSVRRLSALRAAPSSSGTLMGEELPDRTSQCPDFEALQKPRTPTSVLAHYTVAERAELDRPTQGDTYLHTSIAKARFGTATSQQAHGDILAALPYNQRYDHSYSRVETGTSEAFRSP